MHKGLIRAQSLLEGLELAPFGELHRKQLRQTTWPNYCRAHHHLQTIMLHADNSFGTVAAKTDWMPNSAYSGVSYKKAGLCLLIPPWGCDGSPVVLSASSVLLSEQQPEADQWMWGSLCLKLPDWLHSCQTWLCSDSHTRLLAFNITLLSKYNLPDGKCSTAD